MSRPVGHVNTSVMEMDHRHDLRPLLTTGEPIAIDEILRPAKDVLRATEKALALRVKRERPFPDEERASGVRWSIGESNL